MAIPPAEDDDEKHLHDAPVFDPAIGPPKAVPTGYTQTFAETVIKLAEADDRIVAITAAMAGPTGLLPFEERFPDRFFDVGIAEQHAVTAAAGMAMGGMRPIVAIYSTFLNRAWDQVVYDVALHRLPVVFCIDRAGITGPDGPSHHGVYDLAMLARVPGMRVLAPSSAQELQVMMADAADLADDGPVAIRYPRGRARQVAEHEVGAGLDARRIRHAATRSIRSVSSPSGSSSPPPSVPPTTLPGRASTSRCGTPAAAPRSTRRCSPTPPGIERSSRPRMGFVDGAIGSTIAMRVGELAPAVVTRSLGVPTRFIPHAGTPDEILVRPRPRPRRNRRRRPQHAHHGPLTRRRRRSQFDARVAVDRPLSAWAARRPPRRGRPR